MLLTDQHPHNKSIMISLLGKPNAGKSTFCNHMLGFDLSIVSHKPQTTRNRINCAFTIDRTEVVLVDTPGLHKSLQEMNIRMNGQATTSLEGCDLNFILLDASGNYKKDLDDVMNTLPEKKLGKTWVIFNKADLVKDESAFAVDFIEFQKKYPVIEQFFSISSKKGDNIHLLTGAIVDEAEPGPHLYPDGSVSNKNERFFVSEYIREQAFRVLQEEIPYEVAVTINSYEDLKEGLENFDTTKKPIVAKIDASILVNRPSQRGIVVGKGGSVIKEIGMKARKKIEAMVDGSVFLKLHVKVAPKWFKNNMVLEELGLPRVKDSVRLWRKK